MRVPRIREHRGDEQRDRGEEQKPRLQARGVAVVFLIMVPEAAEQQGEAYTSMVVGMLCAILAMFALLTIEFKSYVQPLLILMIIPFGLVGAILGHGVMGLPISFFSMMGMVALTGQWWLDSRKMKKAEVAAHLVNLAWNGLAGLEKKPGLTSAS